MAIIVNLRQAKKSTARTEKEVIAAANRAKFGQTKAVKSLDIARAALETQNFNGHKLVQPAKNQL